MHNTESDNLRFKITFTETNIRYLLGETPVNTALIESHRQSIAEAKQRLAMLERFPSLSLVDGHLVIGDKSIDSIDTDREDQLAAVREEMLENAIDDVGTEDA